MSLASVYFVAGIILRVHVTLFGQFSVLSSNHIQLLHLHAVRIKIHVRDDEITIISSIIFLSRLKTRIVFM